MYELVIAYVFIMILFIDFSTVLRLQGPREQLTVLAQTAADPHVVAVGLLHRR